MGADFKTPEAAAPAKVKKAKRDECMLFSTSNDAQKECATLVDQYRQCMAGYGFKI
ncbi:Cytochrome c oxidase copper chaperone [Neocucurbitaria cava]|uniref:Cytochrome c oxidase copper chaperone n=1 Tax=Neocucurbitaria cava TaxID=798079 RepID=A0A9W9CMT9_9PLEO|nr:Cytochrome c oxidase copper chaperone [Neocucurbitaria cava]